MNKTKIRTIWNFLALALIRPHSVLTETRGQSGISWVMGLAAVV